jgi:hypothetical protein
VPNWCVNELTIKGKKKIVQKLKRKVRTDDVYLDFEKIVPTPESIKNTPSSSICNVRLALFGTDKQVEELIDSLLKTTEGETAETVEYKQHIPEDIARAYPEQNLKALWLMFRRYEHSHLLDDADLKEGIRGYEQLANKFNHNLQAHGFTNWYDWRCANWGTKWNLDSSTTRVFEEREKSLAFLQYGFDTAWSPPEAVVKELAKRYPELAIQLRYWEGGMCFQGRLRLKGEKVYEDRTWEYSGSKGG